MDDTFNGRIIIIDDDEAVCSYFQMRLESAGFYCESVTNLTDMRDRVTSVSFDAALLDLNLGSEDGYDGLSAILKDAPFTKVFVLTANGSVAEAVKAMRCGAAGFFEKGKDNDQLIQDICQAVHHHEPCLQDLANVGLIGNSPAIMDIVEKIRRLQNVDSTVLLLGESGTGKEVIARAIHRLSQRDKKRFGAVNCGAIPEALLESELFGHRRGAFTDAKADRQGIFELCSNGTLLLDEIGDMPLSLQMKLLRVLQEREITPVGSSSPVKINTRVIAATHRNVLEEVRAKRFREDLYFRLSIIVLHIPPLRDRKEDIPALANHFLEMFNRRFEKNIRSICPNVMRRLISYDWPGNIRELQNAIERGVVLAANDEIDIADLFPHMKSERPLGSGREMLAEKDAFEDELFDLPLSQAKQTFEKMYLEHHIRGFEGQVAAVAERAGRYRADVYRLLTRHGIDHAQFRKGNENHISE